MNCLAFIYVIFDNSFICSDAQKQTEEEQRQLQSTTLLTFLRIQFKVQHFSCPNLDLFGMTIKERTGRGHGTNEVHCKSRHQRCDR